MSVLLAIPLIALMTVLNVCCGRPSKQTLNSQRILVFYRAFLGEHYSKPPEFYNSTNLQYFDDFYSEDVGGIQNPVNSAWWSSVTQADIDAAFPIKNAMHAYLTRARSMA